MTTALEIKHVSSGYGQTIIDRDIMMQVEEKEAVAIIGPNGAGKTTLLSTVMGLIRPQQGQIFFHGEDITGLGPHQAVAKGLVMVPQARWLFPTMSVHENLLMGSYLVRDATALKESFDLVFSLFPILKERRNQLARTMSGGQQQMLAVGRALMARPKMILLDEPSSGLAPALTDELYASIRKLKEDGMTLLIVEQDVVRALTLAERAYALQQGKIILQESAEKLLAEPDLAKRYLTSY